MKKIFLCGILLSRISPDASSQGLKSISGHCGLYYKTMDQLNRQIGDQAKFYDFHAGQIVASIGAQCANWEAALATKTDSIVFYLEDIDSGTLNNIQVAFAWDYYSALRKKTISCDYKIIIGTQTSTHLPDQLFDKILIINSFHEFTDQKQMLHDITKKLKPSGILYIDETLATKSGELHIQCGKKIFTSDEMISICKENGFNYVDSLDIYFRKTNPVRKIFAFKKNIKTSTP